MLVTPGVPLLFGLLHLLHTATNTNVCQVLFFLFVVLQYSVNSLSENTSHRFIELVRQSAERMGLVFANI